MSQYSPTAAFWLFNRVSNFCYLRYDAMIQDVRAVQGRLENDWIAQVGKIDGNADNKEITSFSHQRAAEMMDVWNHLDHLLLTKYIDGNIKHIDKDGNIETTETGVVRFPQQPKYPDWFYRQIVNDKGPTLEVKE
jgi:dipeptidase